MSAVCAVHTDQPASGTCPRCGNFVCDRCERDAVRNCPACVKLVGAAQAVTLPWEQREALGLAKAFVEQVKLAILKPGLYVSAIRPTGSWREAFTFGWLVSAVVGVLSIPYNAFNFWSQGAQLERSLAPLGGKTGALQALIDLYQWLAANPFLAAGALAAYTIVIYPPMFLLNAGTQQLGLALAGVSRRQPITATLRAGAYSHAVNLLVAIPVVGGFAAFYTLVVQVWALREVHKTTTFKAIFATLWFSVVLGCCGAFAIFGFLFQALSRAR